MTNFFATIAVHVVVIAMPTVVIGQGILGGTDEIAKDYLSRFATSGIDLPNEFATITRTEMLSKRPLQEFVRADRIYLFADRKIPAKPRKKLLTIGYRNFREGDPGVRVWNQILVSDGITLSRRGNPTARWASHLAEPNDVAKDDSKIKRIVCPHPYFHPFATKDEAEGYLVGETYGNSILETFELRKSKRGEKGLIESTWHTGERLVHVSFDPKIDGRPTKIVYMGLENPIARDEPEQISQINTIEWAEWKLNDKQVCLVPIAFTKSLNVAMFRLVGDIEGKLSWKELESDFDFPTDGTGDWREPFRQLFEENWKLSYRDVLTLRNLDE